VLCRLRRRCHRDFSAAWHSTSSVRRRHAGQIIPSQRSGCQASSLCVRCQYNWCAAKRLQLNTKKTEVMWFGSATNLSKFSSADRHLKVGCDNVSPSTVVSDLDVFFDSELTMKSHISRITSACFYQLCSAGPAWTGSYRSFSLGIHPVRLDYCNVILAGLPVLTLAPLHRVMHASAQVVYDLKPYDHVTPALKALHWLPIKQRIEFKLSPGLSSHQQQSTCLPTEPPDNYCVRVWSGIKPLG